MTIIEPMKDDGQRLPALHGHVIGFVNDAEQFDDAVQRLCDEGFTKDQMSCLYGEDGIAMIERVQQHFFGDAESEIGKRGISALRDGKYTFAVKVAGGDEAKKVALTAQQAGAFGCIHFGMFINTRIT